MPLYYWYPEEGGGERAQQSLQLQFRSAGSICVETIFLSPLLVINLVSRFALGQTHRGCRKRMVSGQRRARCACVRRANVCACFLPCAVGRGVLVIRLSDLTSLHSREENTSMYQRIITKRFEFNT